MKRILVGALMLCTLGASAQAQEAYFVVERGQDASCEVTPRPEPADTVIGDPDGYPSLEEAEAARDELCDED